MTIREEQFYIVSVGDREGDGFNELTLPSLVSIVDEFNPDGIVIVHSGIVALFRRKRHDTRDIQTLCDSLDQLRNTNPDYSALGIGLAEGQLIGEFDRRGKMVNADQFLGDARIDAVRIEAEPHGYRRVLANLQKNAEQNAAPNP
jgi:hypothetical protein